MKTTNPMPDARADRFVRGYLKTRHLVLLVELGRRGSIMQAAHAANLTQPAASKLLGELEHALGVPLFERLPRGVEPTWYGKVLIRRAGASLAEMDAACDEVMGLQPGLRGRVAIGAILTPSTTLVPRALALLKARHGHANASIKVDISRRLIECLRAGELDLVIGRIADAAGAGELDFEPVSDEPHGLIVRAGHPLLAQSQLALGDVAPCQWILPPEGGILRERIAALFASQDLAQPADTVTAAAPPAIIALLMGSDMLAPMPVELVQPYLDSGLLAALPCAFDLRMDVYGIVTRRRHHLSPAATAMLAALREAGALRTPA